MPLNSYAFILGFLPLVLLGYRLIGRGNDRWRSHRWLLVASIAFYAFAGIGGLILIGISIVWNYAFARMYLSTPASLSGRRQHLIYGAIILDILFLCYFKYSGFLQSIMHSILGGNLEASAGHYFPLGLSFLIFQKIAFLADVRSGQVTEIGFSRFALFTLFFPRAIAGPIVRYSEFERQLESSSSKDQNLDIAAGICLLAIGLFKQSFLASIAGDFVPHVFEASSRGQSIVMIDAWIGALAYSLQLYFDFSGYSDMALGVARLFGIKLPMNFNSPFKATSLIDFWSRWHITLTRFLTWHIYIPLVRHLTQRRERSGKSVLCGSHTTIGALITVVGLPSLITMAVSGVWHGAGWNYLLWGVLHGILLSINQSWRLVKGRWFSDEHSYRRWMNPLGRLMTLFSVICAMVIFRADTVSSAISILKGMSGANGILPYHIQILMNHDIEGHWISLTWFFYERVLWLGVMIAIVLLAPNSLEMLHSLQPASDFTPLDRPRAFGARRTRIEIVLSALIRWTRADSWLPLLSKQNEFLWSSKFSALLYGLAFVLGLCAISNSRAVIYGAF